MRKARPFIPNEVFQHPDGSTEIILERRDGSTVSTWIDSDDYDKVKDHRWCLFPRMYVHTSMGWRDRSPRYVGLHTFLLDTPNGMHTDHIDGDPLNNRRSNLRVATASQNCGNARKRKNTSSQFKGVTWRKNEKKWAAQIMYKRHTYHLGRFYNEIEAARAYDAAARKYFGRFARCNFPEPGEQVPLAA